MSANPWSKFYWHDWDSDPCLRACSLAAQGLWMRMLCIAAKSQPAGYVTINGRSPDLPTLARLCGCAADEAEALVSELGQNGVFSRDRQGRIYSRRIIRDAQRVATNKKKGKLGGNPSLCNDEQKNRSVIPSDIPPDKPHKPEAREEPIVSEPRGSDTRPKASKSRHEYPEDFERWWKAYPTDANMSKYEAHQAWRRLPAEDKLAAFDSLPGFNAYCQKDTTYRPIHANRYLLKRRFEGFVSKSQEISRRTEIRPETPEWNAWRAHFRDTGKQFSVKYMDDCIRNAKPYIAPSQWPPNFKPRVDDAA